MHDLAIVLVSHHGERWLRPCLRTVYERVGDCAVDVVVVSNSDDGTDRTVAAEFPQARVVRCENRGFAHANNQGVLTCDARYVLFLNVDTEVREGTFAELVAALDARPGVGAAGVRQVAPDGSTALTIRRFPNAVRSLAEALGSERWPVRSRWLGERERDPAAYEREVACDWTSGSFLVVRREALLSAGLMDERFFLYSEEPDLCRRLVLAGWEIRHLPVMTILHHAGGRAWDTRLAAQDAFARMQFARKHFSPPHRLAYAAALALGYGLRAAAAGGSSGRRKASLAALKAVARVGAPPFGPPPEQAVAPRAVLGR